MTPRRASSGLIPLLGVLGVAAPSAADPSEPPLLLGGPVTPAPRSIYTDPRLPTGAEFSAGDRPASPGAVCSDRLPVCAHGVAGGTPSDALQALAALELAYERLVYALGLPAPLGDEGRGGSDAFDLYLARSDRTTAPFARVRTFHDTPRSGGFDSASGFCTVMADGGALLERAATLCLGEAIALRLDPAETPHLRRAFATELWWIVGAPTSFDFEAIDGVQARPRRALAARDLSATSEGSALLFEYLEAKLGAGGPGELATALFTASAQTTPVTASRWSNEPDAFDVLRHTLGDSEQRLAGLLGDLAVARAFLGEREDGLHLPSLAWAGRSGAANFDWVIPYASLPRRVRATPIEPTGAVLVWLDLAGAPATFTLGFQAEWEPPAEFQWTLVRVGPDGDELGRLEVPFQERETSVEARLVNVTGASAVIVVGAHLERVDLDHAFDPDVAPFEPHSALVYLVEI